MSQEFGDRADFISVYISEAHSTDEWRFENNVCYKQPRILQERIKIATDFVERENCIVPLVVDLMDNNANKKYFAFPERLFIVVDGVLEYAGLQGPYDYNLDEVEEWLRSH